MLSVERDGAWRRLPLRLNDVWVLAMCRVGSRPGCLRTPDVRALQIASKQVYR